MGLSSKKQKDIPEELQPFPPEFETIPAFDNSKREPKSGVAVPTPQAVEGIKTFMNINKQ